MQRKEKMNKWTELSSKIKNCKKCKGLNSETYGTQNAPGYGSKESKAVIIGQSLCGKPCIESQIPFTDGSGKLLDEAFKIINIRKSDIYITNVVKCHPPGNRTSEKHEIENCTPYLKTELEWLEPTHIICLGKDAWKQFSKSIEKPTVQIINGINIHFLYHPSYIIRKSKEEQSKYIKNIAEIISESRN